LKKIIAPRALTGVKLGGLIREICVRRTFRWQVEGTHQPEFPQITLLFSTEVAPSQKQTAQNKSPIKEISTTESKYLSLHKIQYPYVILKSVDQNVSRWG
jgi:hypothetical protein